MKVYVHQGAGHWVGSAIVVATTSLVKAKNMVRKELDAQGLKDEELNVKLVLQGSDNTDLVLLSINGEY